MTDPNDPLRVGGGAPPLGPDPSLAEAEKAMRSGKGGLVAVLVGLALVLGAGLAFFMGGDDDEPYETLGQNVNRAQHELFSGFWGCVFQGREEVGDNEELARELHERARRGGPRFAAYVRRECTPKLDELEPRLRALIPPDDMVASLNAEIAAVEQLRGAVSDYLAYLEGLDPEVGYDEEAAADKVRPVARDWYEFKRAHAELNRALRERLH